MNNNTINSNVPKIDNRIISNYSYTPTNSTNYKTTSTSNYTQTPTLRNATVETVSFGAEIKTYLPTDVVGFYGGDQTTINGLRLKKLGSILTFGIVKMSDFEKRHLNMYYTILSKYGITRKGQQTGMMSTMTECGCGYVTIANMIADYYKSNSSEFERIYGYPLYDKNEDGKQVFNYDYILVDVFARNNQVDAVMKGKECSVKTYNYEEILKNSFTGQNVSITSYPKDISIETYKQAMESGKYQYASIAVSDYELTPYGSNPDKKYTSKNGHLMTITGISENGNFIVSSWGKEWELTKGKPQNSYEDGGLFLVSVGGN